MATLSSAQLQGMVLTRPLVHPPTVDNMRNMA
jgi:hypothetical protein